MYDLVQAMHPTTRLRKGRPLVLLDLKTVLYLVVLLQLECRRRTRAPLWSSMVLRAAASTDGENCCRRRRHAQLTPLYGLVRHDEQVVAATFVAREQLIVGGLDISVSCNHIAPGSSSEALNVVP